MPSQELEISHRETIKRRRYNLALPETEYLHLTDAAKREDTTFVTVLRRFIKLGLMALEIEERGGQILIRREGQTDQQIKFL